LTAHCAAHLAPYKVPAAIHVIEELPRNSAGKVLKAALRALEPS
jgi:fatty-acyl-CoA synthase